MGAAPLKSGRASERGGVVSPLGMGAGEATGVSFGTPPGLPSGDGRLLAALDAGEPVTATGGSTVITGASITGVPRSVDR